MTPYIIVTPVRNEAEFLPNTVKSVAAQTVKPARWVIVDDGSDDQTGTIAAAAATQFNWITALKRADRGYRHAGAGVIEAFYDGYRVANGETWNFLVKLDGDITLPSNYFEECFTHFDTNKSLGVAGGLVCKRVRGELVPESKIDPAFHVRGATKIYRRQCWHDIGHSDRASSSRGRCVRHLAQLGKKWDRQLYRRLSPSIYGGQVPQT